MPRDKKYTEVDISDLLIREEDLPKVRQKGTNSMITDRSELLRKLKGKGLEITPGDIEGILKNPKFTSKKTGYGGGVFITTEGIQALIDTVNSRIQNTWDEETIAI